MRPDKGLGGALAARRSAARRLPPLQTRSGSTSLAAYDPALEPREPEPSTFGLSDGELGREARRLCEAGWARWEISARLTPPGAAA